jgi:hypothetical protein
MEWDDSVLLQHCVDLCVDANILETVDFSKTTVSTYDCTWHHNQEHYH